MNDQPAFENFSDDDFTQPAGVNRILRFEPGMSLAVAEDDAPSIPVTDLSNVDLPHRIYLLLIEFI